MVRLQQSILAVLAIGWAAVGAAPGQAISEDDARRLADENRTLRAQYDVFQKHLSELQATISRLARQNDLLRETLVRRGVDVEALLAPPASQPHAPAAPVLMFQSPEAMAEFLRAHYAQRVRPDLTQLQRQAALADFNGWLSGAAVLPTQVTWMFRMTDSWRATSPDKVGLSYFVDRQPLVPRLANLTRTLEEIEMLELNLSRLKAEQKIRKAAYELRTRQFAEARPTHKQLAEKDMKTAYDRYVEVNVLVRLAEGRYSARKTPKPARRVATRPDQEFHLIVHARGTHDDSLDVNIFCSEQDAERLMAAPKDSLLKVRGWISDIALGERLTTVGYRIDHAEILAVNCEEPAPSTRPGQ